MGAQSAVTLLTWLITCNAIGSPPPRGAASPADVALAFFDAMPRDSAQLLRLLRPKAADSGERERALSDIPSDNVVKPNAEEAEKIAGLHAVLAYHKRQEVFALTMIDLPRAAVALHARAVLLMSRAAVHLLSDPELQAVVAHEIGHEYFWSQYSRARARSDLEALQTIELLCDGIALLTLEALGIDPKNLSSAVEKIARFNEVPDSRWGSNGYPSPDERRRFVRALVASRASRG